MSDAAVDSRPCHIGDRQRQGFIAFADAIVDRREQQLLVFPRWIDNEAIKLGIVVSRRIPGHRVFYCHRVVRCRA